MVRVLFVLMIFAIFGCVPAPKIVDNKYVVFNQESNCRAELPFNIRKLETGYVYLGGGQNGIYVPVSGMTFLSENYNGVVAVADTTKDDDKIVMMRVKKYETSGGGVMYHNPDPPEIVMDRFFDEKADMLYLRGRIYLFNSAETRMYFIALLAKAEKSLNDEIIQTEGYQRMLTDLQLIKSNLSDECKK